ncbi:MAG: prepilin-type N-terminal cleavage/methylation domain-containing protein [Gallionella sp.]|nr:prepilin-type N-terminal cleavage/methylation domain-containing protein [Gallionella sp.]
MLNASPSMNSSGFSLIELLIGIAIFGIAMSFGMSSFSVWTQNSQIRTAAESIQNGLQRARGEAVQLNTNVAFILGANSDWSVNAIAANGTPINPAIDSRSSNEGSRNVTRNVTPGGATMVTFNSLGTIGVRNNPPFNVDGSAPIRQILLDSAVLSAADSRELRVWIGNAAGVGGSIKICDPNLAAVCP